MGAFQGRILSTLLDIRGLTVRHGALTVLDGLDLTVSRGELFVLLGGSGAGKTTLLRAIAGLASSSAGRIVLDGADITALPPHRRAVNTMFQSFALFPHMSVADNIAFGPRRLGLPRAEIQARVTAMLALVRLEGLENRRPHELSGGQQQRVALARGLAPNPSLLLLDEPLSALDRGLRAETRAELTRLHQRLGATFILVTHDQDEAFSMATRIGIMDRGRIVQTGAPEDVYERPVNRFVAEFLGVGTILPGAVRPDGLTFELPDAVVRLASPATPGPASLGLRAERLRVNDLAPPNQVTGVLEDQVHVGERLLLTVRLAGGGAVRASRPLSDGFAAARLATGSRVTLSWWPDACMVLAP